MAHPYFAGTARPRALAHRGFVTEEAAADGVVENTRAAFAGAVALGAEYLESDCHLSRDGRVVLVHDADLRRVVGDPRRVADLTRAELGAILADRGGLLTLDEALEAFPGARFNIDVKAAAAAEAAGRIAAPHAHRVLLTSFSDAIRLRALRAAESAGGMRPATSPGRGRLIRILAATALGSRRLAADALRGLDALQIPERHRSLPIFGARLVDAAHASGVEVHVWTVNEPERMRSLIARGADGVITDRLDLALAALR